jgi:IS5 family transposase
MKRRAAVESIIGHVKADHRMARNHLKDRDGDRASAALAAAGYNFNLLVSRFKALLPAPLGIILRAPLAAQVGWKSSGTDSSQTTR